MCLKWLPRGLPRPWRAFWAARRRPGHFVCYWHVGIGPCSSVQAGFRPGSMGRLLGNLAQIASRIQKSPVFLGVPHVRTTLTAASRTLAKLRWLSPLAVHGPVANFPGDE